MTPLESGAGPLSTTRTNKGARNELESRAGEDQRILRERAERLLEAAQTLQDVTQRTALVLEAAMLHRLATAAEEQLTIIRARHPLFESDRRSFSNRRPERTSLN